MPTVIDALVVTLGLDPKNFTEAQKQVAAEFLKLKENALRQSKEIEDSGKVAARYFTRVQTAAIGMFAAFLGGRGLKEFTVDMTRMQAETGKAASVLGISARDLSAFRSAMVLAGGTAAGATASLGGFIGQFTHFALTGEGGQSLAYLRSLQHEFGDLDLSIESASKKPLEFADNLAEALKRLAAAQGGAKAAEFGRAFGIDDTTLAIMIKYGAGVKGLREEAERLGVVEKDQVAISDDLIKSWAATEQAATTLGRTILNNLAPALSTLLNRWTEIFKAFGKGEIITPGSFFDRLINGTKNVKRNADGSVPSIFESMIIPGGPLDAWLRSKGLNPTPGQAPAGPPVANVKPGAGQQSVATAALARTISAEVPGVDRFTAFNDPYHQLLGRRSAHTEGLALDFTVKDQKKSAEVAEQIRRKLASMNVDAKVIDEYKNPSRGSTGGHIHVQISTPAAADRLLGATSPPPGARTSAAASAANVSTDNRTSTSTATTTIGKIEVHTPATDGPGVASDLKKTLERENLAPMAQGGPN